MASKWLGGVIVPIQSTQKNSCDDDDDGGDDADDVEGICCDESGALAC